MSQTWHFNCFPTWHFKVSSFSTRPRLENLRTILLIKAYDNSARHTCNLPKGMVKKYKDKKWSKEPKTNRPLYFCLPPLLNKRCNSIQKISSIRKFIVNVQQILGSHELKSLTIFDHAHSKIIESIFNLSFLNLYQYAKKQFIPYARSF